MCKLLCNQESEKNTLVSHIFKVTLHSEGKASKENKITTYLKLDLIKTV